MPQAFQRDLAIKLLHANGPMRLCDLKASGIYAITLTRMVEEGEIVRVAHGIYELPDATVAPDDSLAEIAARIPKGVLCLHSALAYHGIILKPPRSIWLAIGNSDPKPKLAAGSLRLLRFGANALICDVQTVTIDGVKVRVFSAAKSVVDCFRYRRVVGLDVALEALRLALISKKAWPGEIIRIAKSLRIWSVIRPHLERAMTAT